MTILDIDWKKGVDWDGRAGTVLNYFQVKPHLKFGPAKFGKAISLLDVLCAKGCATRAHLKNAHGLDLDDDVATILGNVTMALQESGAVLSPQEGGWYATLSAPFAYVVCPGFSQAWTAARAK